MVSKMLVSYHPCGCRVGVLLDVSDPELVLEFRADAETELLTVREEEHERIGAHFCKLHADEMDLDEHGY